MSTIADNNRSKPRMCTDYIEHKPLWVAAIKVPSVTPEMGMHERVKTKDGIVTDKGIKELVEILSTFDDVEIICGCQGYSEDHPAWVSLYYGESKTSIEDIATFSSKLAKVLESSQQSHVIIDWECGYPKIILLMFPNDIDTVTQLLCDSAESFCSTHRMQQLHWHQAKGEETPK